MLFKRRFYVVLVLSIGLMALLSACGDSTPTPSANTAAATATTASTSGASSTTSAAAASGKRYQIALVIGQTSDNFYTSMQCGAQEAANKFGDVDLVVQGPQKWDATLQTPIINALIAKKVDAMAVVVNDGKALYQPLKQANDAGIKIVGVDTKLDDTSFEVTNISSDNRALGVETAKTLAKLMGDKGVALTSALTPGLSTVSDRIQGFLDEMKANHPNIQVVFLGAGTDTGQDATVAAVNAAFVAHPDITGIFPVANQVSEAVATSVKGLPADKRKNLNVVGFDAGPAPIAALQNGQVQALIAQKPAEMGSTAIDAARKALRGEPVEKLIPTTGVGLTKDNLLDPNFSKFIYKSAC